MQKRVFVYFIFFGWRFCGFRCVWVCLGFWPTRGDSLFSPVKPHTNYTCAFYKSTHNIFLGLATKIAKMQNTKTKKKRHELCTTRTYFHFHGQNDSVRPLSGVTVTPVCVCRLRASVYSSDKYANTSAAISLYSIFFLCFLSAGISLFPFPFLCSTQILI